jgi:hypothetical protein
MPRLPLPGLSVQERLASLELPRSTWYYHKRQRASYSQKYRHLREPREAIARRSPEYGYRRTTVELHETYRQRVNHKVVQRLHCMWDLPLIRGTRPPKPSGVRQAITAAGNRIKLVAGKGTFASFEVTYADFTELVYANGRAKAQLMPIVDHATKVVLGWAVGERAVTPLALEAWGRAVQALRSHGVRLQRVIVHHDQDIRSSPAMAGPPGSCRKTMCGCPMLSTAPAITQRWRASQSLQE